MQKNSGDFSMQEAMRLASTPAGQQLLALLKQADPETMQKAMEQALRGDVTQAKQTLQPLTGSEEIQKLMKQLGG